MIHLGKPLLAALLLVLALTSLSFADSVPPFDPGSAPTKQVWNGYWSSKADTNSSQLSTMQNVLNGGFCNNDVGTSPLTGLVNGWCLGVKPISPGFPVPTYRATTPDTRIAIDLFPNGVVPDYGVNMSVFPNGQVGAQSQGQIWWDTCNTDLPGIGGGYVCAHQGIDAENDAIFWTSESAGSIPSRILFGDSTNGVWNGVYSVSGDGFAPQGLVRGASSTLGGALTQEEASTNLLINSNAFASWPTLTNVTVTASAHEDPRGGTNASLISATVAAGFIQSATASIAADSNVYTLSTWINAASVTQTGDFVELVMSFTGGSTKNYGVIFKPSTTAIAVAPGTAAPNGCINTSGVVSNVGQCFGIQRVVNGCVSGCASTGEVWYRVWLTGTNNGSDTSVGAVIYPASGGLPASLIAFNAQIEEQTFPSKDIITGGSAVTRAAGEADLIAAPVVAPFAGSGSRPLCVLPSGKFEVGSVSGGSVTCP